jgi:hypothetical protein
MIEHTITALAAGPLSTDLLISSSAVRPSVWVSKLQVGSNMTWTDFFKTIIAKHLLAHVSLQGTPLRSQHIFFQRSGSILMPFSKKACGWQLVYTQISPAHI